MFIMVNCIFSLIIFGLLPQCYKAINQVQHVKGKLDPKWSEYLAELAGDYDEVPSQIETSPPPPTAKTGWSLARYGDSTFVAVIHKNVSSEASVVSLDAGNACGAVLVSTEKLLTHCFCLASWYNWVKNGASGTINPGAMKSKYDLIAEQIYVTYSELDFSPDFLTKLQNKWEGPAADCPPNADHLQPKMVDVIVVKFFPPINQSRDGDYMPWPPYPIIKTQRNPGDWAVVTLGYGMQPRSSKKFWNEFGEEIHVNISTVKFTSENEKFEACTQNPDLWKTLPQELSEKVTCFQARSKTFELCGGIVGNPVLLGGSIHGLVMSTMSCEQFQRNFAVLHFDQVIRDKIEILVGKDLKSDKTEYLSDDDDGKEVVYRDFKPPTIIIRSIGTTSATSSFFLAGTILSQFLRSKFQ